MHVQLPPDPGSATLPPGGRGQRMAGGRRVDMARLKFTHADSVFPTTFKEKVVIAYSYK